MISLNLIKLMQTIHSNFQTNATQWNKLTSSNKRNWTGVNEGNSAVVALIEWLPDLTKTTMPYVLLNKLEKLETKKSEPNPLDGSELKSLSENEQEDLDEHVLSDLVQWSDLIMFDYLTGNYDRVASMQVSVNFYWGIILYKRKYCIDNLPSSNVFLLCFK